MMLIRSAFTITLALSLSQPTFAAQDDNLKSGDLPAANTALNAKTANTNEDRKSVV